jgi:ComF family protein
VACGARLGDDEQRLACGLCWSRLPYLTRPQCERCGYPAADGACRWCALLPPYVRAARSVAWMPDGVAGELIHAFKYDGWHRLADGLAATMARLAWPPDVIDERVALVPVPLAPRRLRQRGFNQSERLAQALSRRWHLPVWGEVLSRTHFTASQTRLTQEQRLQNVASAFNVPRDSARLRGTHVVLVDDVVTTAATMNACAAVLFAAGVRIISYVTFGRARLPGDAPS